MDDTATPQTPPLRHLAAHTQRTYNEHLRYIWQPYAERNGLPPTFTEPDTRPLTIDEVTALFGAAGRGTLHNPNARNADTRSGKPYSPDTLNSLLSALRRAHHTAGLTWVGDTYGSHLGSLRKAYEINHPRASVKAKPMTKDEVATLFATAPDETDETAFRSSLARALSLQGRISINDAGNLTTQQVTVGATEALIHTATGTCHVPCVTDQVAAPLGSVSCAHCLLAHWTSAYPDDQPLTPTPNLRHRVRTHCRQLTDAVTGATFTDGMLTVDDGPLSPAGLALIWSPQTILWLRARAAILTMRAAGLRLDDLDHLDYRNVRFRDDTVTLLLQRKHDKGDGTPLPLKATGRLLCPVAALKTYDAWVNAFLPERRALFVPIRGRATRFPVDPPNRPSSTALYQQIATYLRDHLATDEVVNPHVRQRATPHSARRGFAVEAYDKVTETLEAAHQPDAHRRALDAVRRALGHARDATTLAYLDAPDDSATPLFASIDVAKEADNDAA